MSAFIILIVYFILVAIIILVAVLNFFPVIRYGFLNRFSATITFAFLGIMVGIVLVTMLMVRQVDWHQQLFSTSTNITNELNDAGSQ